MLFEWFEFYTEKITYSVIERCTSTAKVGKVTTPSVGNLLTIMIFACVWQFAVRLQAFVSINKMSSSLKPDDDFKQGK